MNVTSEKRQFTTACTLKRANRTNSNSESYVLREQAHKRTFFRVFFVSELEACGDEWYTRGGRANHTQVEQVNTTHKENHPVKSSHGQSNAVNHNHWSFEMQIPTKSASETLPGTSVKDKHGHSTL